MPDFTVRSDALNVEQIMDQVRARIREKRGLDDPEPQIHGLATVKLENLRAVSSSRSDVSARDERAPALAQPPLPDNYTFEEQTLFESHRGLLRLIRRLLNPLLKLLFNPNPLIQALNIQSRLNASRAEAETRRDAAQHAVTQAQYEVLHELVTETTRLRIEVKNLKMCVESLTGRLEFNERRARAIESAVTYKATPEDRPPSGSQKPPVTVEDAPPTVREAAVPDAGRPVVPGGPLDAQGQRSRRRRRRRGRRGAGSTPGGNAQPAQSAAPNETSRMVDDDERDFHPGQPSAADSDSDADAGSIDSEPSEHEP